MVSRVIPVDTFDLVIFGGTGDLARRKIFPGLYRRYLAGQMNADSRIIGAARAKNTGDQFREMIRASLLEFVPKDRQDPAAIAAFLAHLDYVSIDKWCHQNPMRHHQNGAKILNAHCPSCRIVAPVPVPGPRGWQCTTETWVQEAKEQL